VRRTIEDASNDPKRWSELVEHLGGLPSEAADMAVEELEAIDPISLGPGVDVLANALRDLVGHHGAFPNAHWSMPEDRLGRLRALVPKFTSEDVVERVLWLFESHPSPEVVSGGDWGNYETQLRHMRDAAVSEVVEVAGWDGVEALVRRGDDRWAIGVAVASLDGMDEQVLRRLPSDDAREKAFAGGYFRRRADNAHWARSALINSHQEWRPETKAELLLTLTPDPQTWSLAEELGDQTEREYWTKFRASYVPADPAFAAAKVLAYGRPWQAIDLLSIAIHGKHEFPASVAVDAIRQAASTPPEAPVSGSLSYDLAILLNHLEKEGVEDTELAGLEFPFVNILESSERRELAITRVLSGDPALFSELVIRVYRADDAEDDPADGEIDTPDANWVRAGWELLRVWKRLPGTTDGGDIDAAALGRWLDDARAQLAQAGRSEIGDRMIGHVLAHSPVGADGLYPHESVRDSLERVGTDSMMDGFAAAAFSRRGVTTRSVFAGGDQEREAARHFRTQAAGLAAWPRVARTLVRIAEAFDADAVREDERARQRQDL
jgi:hypothetical protein